MIYVEVKDRPQSHSRRWVYGIILPRDNGVCCGKWIVPSMTKEGRNMAVWLRWVNTLNPGCCGSRKVWTTVPESRGCTDNSRARASVSCVWKPLRLKAGAPLPESVHLPDLSAFQNAKSPRSIYMSFPRSNLFLKSWCVFPGIHFYS